MNFECEITLGRVLATYTDDDGFKRSITFRRGAGVILDAICVHPLSRKYVKEARKAAQQAITAKGLLRF
jgi:hypothetical protein